MVTEWLQAVALGIIEGLTEFIPVSSTGHLILTGKLIKFNETYAATFEIFIQLGAILAVVWLYWGRFVRLLPGKKGESSSGFDGWDGIGKLFVGCLPAFVLGYLFHGSIKAYLFDPTPVAIALVLGGVVMIFIERGLPEARVDSLDNISWKQCFWIGVFQCFALWPGVSRSASTIIGGLILGLNRRTAAEFSFLLAVPVMVAAVGYDLLKSSFELHAAQLGTFAIGFVVSFVVAVFAIRFFLSLLERYTLAIFGWYRVVLGIVVLLLL